MSARMLKKMQLANEPEIPVDNESGDFDGDGDGDGDEELDDSAKHLNPFDLLNQQSLSESEFKEDDNNETEVVDAVSSKKKKKKRRKKVKTGGSNNHISSEDNELSEKYYDTIDPLLDKVETVVPRHTQKSHPQSDDSVLLKIELKHLNPQNEMRRTFGKRVVKVEKRGRQKVGLKSTYMVTAKDSWPPLTKNIITMKPVPIPDGIANDSKNQWFTFEHSTTYQTIQHMFLTALERTDSDFLINLIRRCPYHVDSLLQLSEICKMTEDFSLAAELIERALLVLESSLHINFSLSSGNCRLDYKRQENRPFYIVLFKHAQYLEGRACCRTAFELAKLILSFQPDLDPLAMILVIDYYALRSKQYQWLVNFYDKYNSVRNLSQLPNMSYSYALALHSLHGKCEKSNNALQYALLMFPGVLKLLLEELSVQTDTRVLASAYFNSEVSGNQSPALHQLVCLYVCRAKVIWRQDDVLGWLEYNVNAVLDRIDNKDEVIEDYKKKRSIRYLTPPRPVLRHVILSDFKEKVPLAVFVAREKEAIMTYDPLPPKDSINCYKRKSSSGSSPTTSTNTNNVSMFFQSLLPSFNVNQVAAAPIHGGEAAGAGGAAADQVAEVNAQLEALNANLEIAAGHESYRDLTQSLHSMVDAMRDFLQNFRITEHLQSTEGASAPTTSSEEDSSDYHD